MRRRPWVDQESANTIVLKMICHSNAGGIAVQGLFIVTPSDSRGSSRTAPTAALSSWSRGFLDSASLRSSE